MKGICPDTKRLRHVTSVQRVARALSCAECGHKHTSGADFQITGKPAWQAVAGQLIRPFVIHNIL